MQEQPVFNLEQLQAIFAEISVGVGVFKIDDQKPLFLNKAYYKLVGYDQDAYDRHIAGDDAKIIVPSDMHKEKEIRKEFYATGKLENKEFRVCRKDGRVQWLSLSMTKIRLGKEDCALCFYRNISAAKEKLNYLQLGVNNIGSSVFVMLIRAAGIKMLYANDTFFKLIGISRKDFKETDITDIGRFTSPEDAKRTHDIFAKSLKTGKPQELTYLFYPPKKKPLWMNRRAFVIPQDEKDTYLVVSVSTDINEKRETELALKKEQEQYQNVVDNMPNGFGKVRINKDGSSWPLFMSKRFLEITQMTKEEYLALYAQDSKAGVHPDDVAKVAAMLKSVGNGSKRNIVFRLRKGQNDWVWVSCNILVKEENGYLVAYINYEDLTEEIEQRRKIEALKNNLMLTQKANNAKRDFLSRMSHDIRTPLNAVLGFADLAKDEPDVSAGVADYLEKISSSGKYLLGLINDVLDMAKIESGKIELNRKNIHGLKLLNNIAEIFQEQAQNKNIKLVTDFSQAQTPWIFEDELRSRQIYSNLLSNAIKFSPEGTVINWTIKDTFLTPSRFHRVCTIKDQGYGISEKFLKTIFLPFEQGSSENAAMGTGLGLAIVKSLLDLMDGTIKVESQVGKGSTFTFELEGQLGIPQKEKHVTELVTSASLKGRHILLCEDNKVNMLVTVKFLEKVGCKVSWAKNGRQGLTMYRTAPPHTYDAILMDIRMPVMDGIETAKRIRALDGDDAKNIPIIAMSANAYADDVQKSLKAGMNAHLAKPINIKKFYAVLTELIEKKNDQPLF